MASKKKIRKPAKTKKNTPPKKKVAETKGLFSPEGGWKSLLSGETLRFVVGMLLLIIAIFMLISFASTIFVTGALDQAATEAGNLTNAKNYGGKLGAYTSDFFINRSFGICSAFIPMFLLLLSMKLMNTYRIRLWKWFLNFSILMIWGSIALSIAQQHFFPAEWNRVPFQWGGGQGNYIRDLLCNNIGLIGAIILMLALAILYLIYLTDETINVIRKILKAPETITKRRKKNEPQEGQAEGGTEASDEEPAPPTEEEAAPTIDLTDQSEEIPPAEEIPENVPQDNEGTNGKAEDSMGETMEVTTGVEEEKADAKTLVEQRIAQLPPYDPRKDLEYYKFPSLSLLRKYGDDGPAINMEEQKANKDRIVKVLRDFGVEITGIKATIGPTITLYEITPAPGVRISRIRNLSDDLALNLSAQGVRIIAPIPGKGTIGIEVPNQTPKIVSMENVLNSRRFQETSYELPIALGKTITNEVFMADLAKMPHLLVAGATGQGKSVGLNAIITSLLYKKHPAELKIVMVDPKKVEFSVYAPIEKHFLAKLPENYDPIITDVTKVVQTLKSLCQLMDHRYDLLKKARARNIKEYNQKFISRHLNPEHGHEFMPYIVIIIDEFGDLIMTAGKEVELPIARIAQLARAVGMHMVIATQRPTTNIITGTIKANFPARMAFKVSSMIDSRTILDRPGANQLIGRGDMLFLSGAEPVRVQCAFVDTPEVEAINKYIADQQGYTSAYELPEVVSEDADSGGGGGADTGPLDSMFAEAARLIVIHQQGSTSLLQRKMGLGYNRAGRIMDQMERVGIVGPSRGSKPRDVLVQDEGQLDTLLANLNS
ncbi:MAG: DNA translocase FtsK 4TM domain-containing protein [Alloprevotella sp.]|nr:DNA translocase FtsK 4TM domain-containing protein [Alloprevotella sp.]